MNETRSVRCCDPQGPTKLLKRRFAHEAAGLASAAARVRTGQDPDAVHDLCVSIRALAAMLRTWAGLIDPLPRGAALRSLCELRRGLADPRELGTRIALLQAAGAGHGDPHSSLLEDLRRTLCQQTARASRRVRARRLRPLMERIGAAGASLGARSTRHARGLERARAYVLERRAVARVAVELALAGGDDWRIRRARLAIGSWRATLECVAGAWEAGPDPRPALVRLEELLAAIGDRAALITVIERQPVTGRAPGAEAVLGRLRAERQHALSRLRELAASHGVVPPAAARIAHPARGPVHEPASASPGGADERWERMARWLLGTGRGAS